MKFKNKQNSSSVMININNEILLKIWDDKNYAQARFWSEGMSYIFG